MVGVGDDLASLGVLSAWGAMSEVLNNVVWSAITTDQAHLSQLSHDGEAGCYEAEVAPFCGFGEPTPSAWQALDEVMGPGRLGIMFRSDFAEIPTEIVDRFRWTPFAPETASQYVADGLDPAPDLPLERLGVGDLDEVVDLISLTQPGPFGPRTLEMGSYYGLRRDGDLVAMAGERMRCSDWVEVSAVCVHPSQRRLGLGAALTLAVAHRIRADGHEAILHVRQGNDAAHALYQRIGFKLRAELHGIGFTTE